MPNVVVAELVEPRLQPTIDVANTPDMMPVPGIAQIEAPATGVSDEKLGAEAINVATEEDSLVAEVEPAVEIAAMPGRDRQQSRAWRRAVRWTRFTTSSASTRTPMI